MSDEKRYVVKDGGDIWINEGLPLARDGLNIVVAEDAPNIEVRMRGR